MKLIRNVPIKIAIVGGILIFFGVIVILMMLYSLLGDFPYSLISIIWPGVVFIFLSIFYIVLGYGILTLNIRARNVGVAAFMFWLLVSFYMLFVDPSFSVIFQIVYSIYSLFVLISMRDEFEN